MLAVKSLHWLLDMIHRRGRLIEPFEWLQILGSSLHESRHRRRFDLLGLMPEAEPEASSSLIRNCQTRMWSYFGRDDVSIAPNDLAALLVLGLAVWTGPAMYRA